MPLIIHSSNAGIIDWHQISAHHDKGNACGKLIDRPISIVAALPKPPICSLSQDIFWRTNMW